MSSVKLLGILVNPEAMIAEMKSLPSFVKGE